MAGNVIRETTVAVDFSTNGVRELLQAENALTEIGEAASGASDQIDRTGDAAGAA